MTCTAVAGKLGELQCVGATQGGEKTQDVKRGRARLSPGSPPEKGKALTPSSVRGERTNHKPWFQGKRVLRHRRAAAQARERERRQQANVSRLQHKLTERYIASHKPRGMVSSISVLCF